MIDTIPHRAQHIPLACVPDAIPAAERGAHFRLASRLFQAAPRERLAPAGRADAATEGYAFHFQDGAFEDVARWVGNERRCCPFLAFALRLAPNEGPAVLEITGPAGTCDFLDAELPRRLEAQP